MLVLLEKILKIKGKNSPFLNRQLNLEYSLLFCENEKLHLKNLSTMRASNYLVAKNSRTPDEIIYLKHIERLDSRSQFFLFKSFKNQFFISILGIIVEQNNENELVVDAFFNDGKYVYMSTNEQFVVSSYKDSTLGKLISKLFEASVFAIKDRPFWDHFVSTPPGENLIKVTIISSVGRFACEGTYKSLGQDDFGKNVLDFLKFKTELKDK
jgi:hypothetical protein